MPPALATRPIEPPEDLTIPAAGSETAKGVLSRALGRLVPELLGVGQGLALSAEARADLAVFQALVREVARKNPGSLPSVLRRTAMGTLVRCLRAPRPDSEALLRELIGVFLLHLARASALPRAIRQKAPPKQLVSTTACISIGLPEDTRAVVFENEGKIGIERADGVKALSLQALEAQPPGYSETRAGVTVSRPFFPIDGGTVLALVDTNPLAMVEAHPDKEGNAIDLGGKSVTEWTRPLSEALGLVREHLPDLRGEIELFVQQIVPVGYHDEKHLSASYQEAIGTIYMSLHPSLMTMAEAVIHEFSHNKINALFEIDPVLENAFSPLYTSPVRPDPRPLHGVLLAVHAFLPVARLYERMIEAGHPLAKAPGFSERFARIRQINAEGAEVILENGKPTRVGKAVLDEIQRWHAHYEKMDA
ncbi:HEXXH motif-containing putative peptide modification protein [Polyangium sp. 15x6]|uniref:aKG-HExxH-type peptide beta-hydroxylase n=1 Tax=Polyangium sp. 15x6 TaxID=3042687 RepID=UPI00249A2907|nr:HEXXH motif-containing putative peptide modification protein [Polyangium sp. 15x6]MDI3284861.1 HEXXH motif-containing putative peptide modification protein [Polyangium sp. 15x6]